MIYNTRNGTIRQSRRWVLTGSLSEMQDNTRQRTGSSSGEHREQRTSASVRSLSADFVQFRTSLGESKPWSATTDITTHSIDGYMTQ